MQTIIDLTPTVESVTAALDAMFPSEAKADTPAGRFAASRRMQTALTSHRTPDLAGWAVTLNLPVKTDNRGEIVRALIDHTIDRHAAGVGSAVASLRTPNAILPADPTDTQAIAARLAASFSGNARTRVFISIAGSEGLTDDEISSALRMNPNTVRPRRGELVTAGLISDSGERRESAWSGSPAIVWRLTDAGRDMLVRFEGELERQITIRFREVEAAAAAADADPAELATVG